MKKMIFGIIIIAFLSLFTMACDNGNNGNSGPDFREDYYGTWEYQDRYGSGEWDKIVISINKIEYSTSDGSWDYTIKNLTWTPFSNEIGSDYYDDYPEGYKITGTLTERISGDAPLNAEGNEGDLGEIVFEYFYLDSDKISLRSAYWDPDNHAAEYGPFYKIN